MQRRITGLKRIGAMVKVYENFEVGYRNFELAILFSKCEVSE
ncbi:MAG: hypothetical protein ACI959_001507 [Limisphaerales bacterium]|jgi:hypothetical protein